MPITKLAYITSVDDENDRCEVVVFPRDEKEPIEKMKQEIADYSDKLLSGSVKEGECVRVRLNTKGKVAGIDEAPIDARTVELEFKVDGDEHLLGAFRHHYFVKPLNFPDCFGKLVFICSALPEGESRWRGQFKICGSKDQYMPEYDLKTLKNHFSSVGMPKMISHTSRCLPAKTRTRLESSVSSQKLTAAEMTSLADAILEVMNRADIRAHLKKENHDLFARLVNLADEYEEMKDANSSD